MKFTFINKPIPRIGSSELAQGRRKFSDDMVIPGAAVLKVFRSEISHGIIKALYLEEALKVPGVIGILTSKHIPGERLYGLINRDQPLLAQDKVRFKGEAIALIASEDDEAAEKALARIRVSYRELTPVFNPEDSLRNNAPLIHEKGNLLHKRVIKRGDVENALAHSSVRIKRRYETPLLEHSYLEPDAGAGYVDNDGTFVIYASTQNPHYDQKEISRILDMDERWIRVIQAATGGGFGSKLDLNVQGFIALALYHFKRPVRMAYGREECYMATSKRHPLIIDLETGVGVSGRLTAMRARIVCDTGAYASYGMAVATRSAVHVTGPYRIPNVDIESVAVYTNNPVAGAMRGFGAPQVAFAYESQMDEMAKALRMDPLQFRFINAFEQGSVTATGQPLVESVGIKDTFKSVGPYYSEACEIWKRNSPSGRSRGVGVGAMWYGIGNTGVKNPASAMIEMDRKGRITLYTGAADIGQGSTTVLTQVAAETMGVDISAIKQVVADTSVTPNAGATSASRQTYISGNAVQLAARKLVDALLEEASVLLEAPKEDLYISKDQVKHVRDPIREATLSEIAAAIYSRGRDLIFDGTFDPSTTPLDPDTGQGVPYATYAFASQVALVEVDMETGQVYVKEIVAAHDVGKAINPLNVEGQIEGGVAMGLGFALMEEYIPGKTISMSEYHIPTAMDVPEVIPIIIENEEPSGPFGAKGVGEPALIPTAPAIINAIADALGKRIYKLPAKPERVWNAIKSVNGQ